MIEWIIFIVIVIIVSEIVFFKRGRSDTWILDKIFSLWVGTLVSSILFGVPYFSAYGCKYEWYVAGNCIDHGPQAFFWFYGIIIAAVLFFWVNKKLLQRKEAKQ